MLHRSLLYSSIEIWLNLHQITQCSALPTWRGGSPFCRTGRSFHNLGFSRVNLLPTSQLLVDSQTFWPLRRSGKRGARVGLTKILAMSNSLTSLTALTSCNHLTSPPNQHATGSTRKNLSLTFTVSLRSITLWICNTLQHSSLQQFQEWQ